MSFVLQPWQLLIIIVSAWMTKFQQELIDYVLTENQVLKEKLGCKRILLNDDQRRRLAVKGKILGRKRLQEIGTLFTPDTIIRWHRQLVAQKWNHQGLRNRIIEPGGELGKVSGPVHCRERLVGTLRYYYRNAA